MNSVQQRDSSAASSLMSVKGGGSVSESKVAGEFNGKKVTVEDQIKKEQELILDRTASKTRTLEAGFTFSKIKQVPAGGGTGLSVRERIKFMNAAAGDESLRAASAALSRGEDISSYIESSPAVARAIQKEQAIFEEVSKILEEKAAAFASNNPAQSEKRKDETAPTERGASVRGASASVGNKSSSAKDDAEKIKETELRSDSRRALDKKEEQKEAAVVQHIKDDKDRLDKAAEASIAKKAVGGY